MPLSRSIPVRTGLLVGLALFACSARCMAPARSPLLHKPAQEFARDDIDGHRVDLAAFRGRVVLLTFWATWCAPCKVDLPRFMRWQTELGPRGFQVIAVSMDDDAAPVLALARSRQFNYPILMGDAQLGSLYGGVLGLPVSFLIDRNGVMVAQYKGEARLGRMKSRIQALLASP